MQRHRRSSTAFNCSGKARTGSKSSAPLKPLGLRRRPRCRLPPPPAAAHGTRLGSGQLDHPHPARGEGFRAMNWGGQQHTAQLSWAGAAAAHLLLLLSTGSDAAGAPITTPRPCSAVQGVQERAELAGNAARSWSGEGHRSVGACDTAIAWKQTPVCAHDHCSLFCGSGSFSLLLAVLWTLLAPQAVHSPRSTIHRSSTTPDTLLPPPSRPAAQLADSGAQRAPCFSSSPALRTPTSLLRHLHKQCGSCCCSQQQPRRWRQAAAAAGSSVAGGDARQCWRQLRRLRR